MKPPKMCAPEEFIPTRQSLLSRLKDLDDAPSWQEFFNTYWRLIYSYALRYGLTEAEAEEVVQETVIEVSRKLPAFRYDPARSFKGWLLQTTRWRIHDQLRKRRGAAVAPYPETPTRTDLMDRLPDPAGDYLEQMWEEEWQRNLMAAALDRVKAVVNPRHYQVFDLLVLKGWPVKKVARTLRVSPGQVYLIKFKLSRVLKREMLALKEKLQ